MIAKRAVKRINKKCRICKAKSWAVLYKGPIRIGKFGEYSRKNHVIWRCRKCKAAFLDRPGLDYETEEYRKAVDKSSSPYHFYALHDGEQADKLKILGTDDLRGKVIADIGCGAGSFLDLVKGYASCTIAVEPAKPFHRVLKSKGHRLYPYCKDALQDFKGKVDIALSFAVLEHLEYPLEFLEEIRLLLKRDGFLLISTPNRSDWLIKFLPEVYAPFFFRNVHTWYFDGRSLENIAKLAGFKKIEIKYLQRFGISNALLWIRDHRPTGLGKFELLQDLDSAYKELLETKGYADFIYARLYV